MGDTKGGAFDIPGELAREWLALPLNPNGRPNSDVVRPWANGLDITRRPRDMWIIDFGVDMTEEQAALYEAPFQYALAMVKPEREQNRRAAYRDRWWIHVEPRPAMRSALQGLDRFVATPRVAKHRTFVWLRASVLADSRLFVIARDDDYTFGVLQSKIHEAWSLRTASWHGVGNDPVYNVSTCLETFPFPRASEEHRSTISAAAAELERLRFAWLNPEGASAAELKRRTLTNLYNDRPTWLTNAHAALDAAVAEAYGWPADLSDDELLRRLLDLNHVRAAGSA
jgi:type II restriction/modification system DNA methylase subunit YeeA